MTFHQWVPAWRQRLERENVNPETLAMAMRNTNPAFIPRNHRIEEAIEAAVSKGDFKPLRHLHPYSRDPTVINLISPIWRLPWSGSNTTTAPFAGLDHRRSMRSKTMSRLVSRAIDHTFKLGAPGTPTGRMITVVKGAIAFFDRDLRIARFRPNVATGSSHARNPNPADGSIASMQASECKTLAARQLAFASIGNIKNRP